MRTLLTIACCSLVIGCTSLPQKADKTEVKNQVVGISKTVCESYSGATVQMAQAYVPIAAGALKFLLDIGFEYKQRELLELKHRASPDAMVVTLPPMKFRDLDEWSANGTCLTVWRSSRPDEKARQRILSNSEPPDAGLVAKFKIRRNKAVGDAVIIEPVSVKLTDTVAFTKKPEEKDERATVNLVFTFALSALPAPAQDNLRTWKSLGAAAMQIPSLPLGATPVACNKDSLGWCQKLQPLGSTGPNVPVVLSVGVTEIGELGIDVDKRLMVAKALRDTIGAGLVEAIGKIGED